MEHPEVQVPEQPALIDVHRRLLERFRHAMNLVGPGAVDVHFEDSRAALEGLEPSGRWADLGSGAGFPGLVFAALFPEVELDLVDSRQKRCVFLEMVLAEGLPADHAPVQAVRTRIERLPDDAYDGALARALAPPDAVLDLAAPLVRSGGRLVLMLNQGQAVPADDRWVVRSERAYQVADKHRKVVVLRRC